MSFRKTPHSRNITIWWQCRHECRNYTINRQPVHFDRCCKQQGAFPGIRHWICSLWLWGVHFSLNFPASRWEFSSLFFFSGFPLNASVRKPFWTGSCRFFYSELVFYSDAGIFKVYCVSAEGGAAQKDSSAPAYFCTVSNSCWGTVHGSAPHPRNVTI